MKDNKFKNIIIFVLIFINIFTLIKASNLNNNNNLNIIKSDELNAYKNNLKINILNSNYELDNITLEDTLNKSLELKDVVNENKQTLVFRFSQMHCESCIVSSISVFQNWIDSIGVNNIIFLGYNQNSRIFKRKIKEYGIQGTKVYSISKVDLPIEELGFPYYFVLDGNLKVSNVFLPEKSTPSIANEYLRNIKKHFEFNMLN